MAEWNDLLLLKPLDKCETCVNWCINVLVDNLIYLPSFTFISGHYNLILFYFNSH